MKPCTVQTERCSTDPFASDVQYMPRCLATFTAHHFIPSTSVFHIHTLQGTPAPHSSTSTAESHAEDLQGKMSLP